MKRTLTAALISGLLLLAVSACSGEPEESPLCRDLRAGVVPIVALAQNRDGDDSPDPAQAMRDDIEDIRTNCPDQNKPWTTFLSPDATATYSPPVPQPSYVPPVETPTYAASPEPESGSSYEAPTYTAPSVESAVPAPPVASASSSDIYTYKVSGSADSADVTWSGDGSFNTDSGVSVPWSKTMTSSGYGSVSATTPYQVTGSLTCTVTDSKGRVVDTKSATSEGDYGFAYVSCSTR